MQVLLFITVVGAGASPPIDGFNLHLDASIKESFTFTRTNRVSVWIDNSSVLPKALQQPDENRQPTYIDNGRLGKGIVRFNDAHRQCLGNILLTGSGNYEVTIFAAVNVQRGNFVSNQATPTTRLKIGSAGWQFGESGEFVQNGKSGEWQVITATSGSQMYESAAVNGSRVLVNGEVSGVRVISIFDWRRLLKVDKRNQENLVINEEE